MTRSGKNKLQAEQADLVQVRGAKQHNLRNLDLDIPRNCLVVFTGVSGSGKSSLAFGTIYAEAQRRYFESIAPYARRLLDQLPAPHVGEITGLPPVVALQQRRAEPTVRSSLGTLTGLSNLLRMLFSRAGTYPAKAARLDSDSFSPNTHVGACPQCHGIGIIHSVSESSLVPDPSLSIREKAIAAYPGAWQGKNYRDILAVLGYDVDKPWRDLAQKDRDWILFTEEKPVVTVYAEREAHRIQRPYQGTYMSAASYVMHTFANTNSATLRKRVSQFMANTVCLLCGGKKLNADALAVRFGGYDIADMGQKPLADVAVILREFLRTDDGADAVASAKSSGKKSSKPTASDEVASAICADLVDRINLLKALGLDYLSIDRATPSLSSGELQRLRLSKQLRAGLFGVVYVLDEPSAGLHPSDSESLFAVLQDLIRGGNSLFVVEHDMEIARKADWIVDLGPGAGERGGALLYCGPLTGFEQSSESLTRRYLFGEREKVQRKRRASTAKLSLSGINRHNLIDLDVSIPLGIFTSVTGVSGSGKTTLVCHVLAQSLQARLGSSSQTQKESDDDESAEDDEDTVSTNGTMARLDGAESVKRVVIVDQKPIGRTPRSNLATYTGLFDLIRQKFAATDEAKKLKFNAGRFSFNVEGGRCEACSGEGFVSVELLFLPSVYSPCGECNGNRYKSDTLQVKFNGLNIAEVLHLTVDAALEFFADFPALVRSLQTLHDIGLGYLRIGQPATELSGGEAQRIKLATELQRVQKGDTLYILDEPTTGLHPADTEILLKQLHTLVDAGNSVVVVEHDMSVIWDSDWIIDLGPGAGFAGGKIAAQGTPEDLVKQPKKSKTASYMAKALKK